MEFLASLLSPHGLTALWQFLVLALRAYSSVSGNDYAPPLSRKSSPFVAESRRASGS